MKNSKYFDLTELNKLFSNEIAREFILYSGNNVHLSPYNIDYSLSFDSKEINAANNSVILRKNEQYIIIRKINTVCSRSIKDNLGWVLDIISNQNEKYTIIIQNQ